MKRDAFDHGGTREVADILFLLAYLLGGGAAPNAVNGDADSSGTPGVADVFFLVNHFFSGGPAPAP